MKNTLRELYEYSCARLADLGIENARHEALLLCRHCLGISGRTDIITHGGDVPAPEAARRLEECTEQRASRPLQYILGGWDFFGMELSVGEGVLIPRDDTMALVETTVEAARHIEAPLLLDLCAGTGAVGLACARELANARVVCVELSDRAMPYLEENVRRFGGGRVFIEKADVLAPPDDEVFAKYGSFDLICSNPPYIPAGEIDGLSRDVQCEPRMALDGGGDGLDFYRAITSAWSTLLRRGGSLAFELGIGEEIAVEQLMRANRFADIACRRDYSGIIRSIIGTML